MKDEIWQKRQFILSSFARQNIKITNSTYRFIDKLIEDEWNSSSMSLNEVDHFIRNEFGKYIGST